MTPPPKVLYLTTTAAPRIAGTDAVFQDIEALRAKTQGTQLSLYPFSFASRFFPPFLLGLHTLPNLRRLASKADLIHIFSPALWRIPALARLDKPLITTLTASLNRAQTHFNVPPAQHQGIITTSDTADKTWIEQQGAKKVVLIPPCIALPSQIPPDARPANFTIFLGSAPWNREQFHSKGLNTLLDAVAAMPSIHLLLLWRGFERKTLAAEINKRHINDRVEVIDRQANVYQLLARSHAAILLAKHPRVIKPYPHSLLEAMLSARPVIVSSCIGISDLVKRTACGIVIDDLAAQTVIDAIQQLQNNYTPLCSCAQALDPSLFSQEKMLQQYLDLYPIVGS